MDTHHSGYPRNAHDFYVEPPWCFDVLVSGSDRTDFKDGFYDPACGVGTIPLRATARGIHAEGSDLVDRPKAVPFPFRVRDFLEKRTFAAQWPAIVMNPPNKLATAFIEKALEETRRGGVVAALAPLSFLASKDRHGFFKRREMERVIILSRRPSMPDGDALLAGAVKQSGGKTNYAWLILRVGGRRGAEAAIDWGLVNS
jgi:hypothetical protein